MNRLREILLYVLLAAALLLPRLPALDSFVTADEPYWLSMGANFYYALGQHEFQNTIYEYQPAVTTMWLATGAMLDYFPEYRGLGQGYLEFEKGMLDPFLLDHDRDPLVLLRDTRVIQVFLIVALMLIVFYLLQRLIGKAAALFAVLLTSFDPFFLGQSRLLDHEAMLALFGLIAVLAFFIYLFQGRAIGSLLLSAVAAGLAQLTKSSGIALLVPIGVLLLLYAFQDRRAGASLSAALFGAAKMFGIWLAVLAVTYVVFWPGMWVAPGKMLHEVYGNAFSYAFQGARLVALDEGQSPPLGLETNLGGMTQMLYGLLWRTTPLTWMGVLLALALTVTRDRELVPTTTRWLGLSLLTLAAAFILMFGLARGRNSPHYILSAYVALGLLAGMGWYLTLGWLAKRIPALRSGRTQMFVLFIALALQARSAFAYYPYFFTYQNPVLSRLDPQEFPPFAYGEGLELSAFHLAALPDAQDLTAVVYYSRGSFSYFFPGHTERFKPYYVDAGHEQDLLDAISNADYLVIYYAIQGRAEKYDRMLSALADVEPEYEVWLNGYKYVIVYRIDSFPPDVIPAMLK
ncbi:MAG TPA: glycosyltransferase family 39 protein [Anaerolineales bacterium]